MALTAPLAAILITPAILSIQRATLAYMGGALIVLLALGIYKYTYRTIILLCIIILCTIPAWPLLHTLYDLLAHKTHLVGQNMRLEELKAVWHTISSSPLSLIFGMGWGGGFHSPAVADIYVNYTHGLFTSMLLKTGLIGLGLSLLYIGALLKHLLTHIRYALIPVLALLGPILIDTILYASFKSLDFGLILLLAAYIHLHAQPIAKQP